MCAVIERWRGRRRRPEACWDQDNDAVTVC